ncbi:MAG: DUF4469 domain-containing protein [Tannerella sp.]|jgi:hypothetical protein|nr:DUF4469 domain-containing protein [Tannerella sp.]
MAIDFNLKDVIHRVTVKFVPTFLPGMKKKYVAHSVLETTLDVHGIASKAEVYNITTPPRVIEEGLEAATKLITYLVADGYKIQTGLVNIRVRIPGVYDGTETQLPEGVLPEVQMTVAPRMRRYIQEHVQLVFDGVEESNGFISKVKDEATGQVNEGVTPDNLVTVRGYGLKIESDAQHAQQTGAFLVDASGGETRVKAVALNTPRSLMLLLPAQLSPGAAYTLLIRTQGTMKSNGSLLKSVREVRSGFTLTAL